MIGPGTIFVARIRITTNAAANTTQFDNLLAAPGAGLRIRVFAVSASIAPNSAGVYRGQVAFNGAIGSAFINGNGNANGGNLNQSWYPNGMKGGTNESVDISDVATIASLPIDISIHYLNEAV